MPQKPAPGEAQARTRLALAIICPARMAALSVDRIQEEAATLDQFASCIGSACAKWVPQVDTIQGVVVCPEPEGEGGSRYPETGFGWCSDNLRRMAFADPAADALPAGA